MISSTPYIHTLPTHVSEDSDHMAQLEKMDALPKVSVIIPTLNEAKNLPYVIPQIPQWMEIVIVDGRSTDNTVEVARKLRPDVSIVMEKTKGKGAALRAGFHAAKGDLIIAMDADGSMRAEELSMYITHMLAGYDYVKGSRFMQGGGTDDMEWYRMAGNWGLLTLVKILFGGRYSDLCYGYFGFWKHALKDLDPECDGFEVETLINIRALRSNLKIAEVPSFEEPRIYGTSNLNAWRDGWRIVWVILNEAKDKYLTRSNTPATKPVTA